MPGRPTTPDRTDTPDPGPASGAPRPPDDVTELLLLELHHTTDPDDRQRLRSEVVASFLALADGLAHRYAGRGVDREDLEQVARTALVVAVERYRPDSGTRAGFVAFAVPTITGELKRHFRDCGWMVRPPRRLQELRAEVSVAEEGLRHRHGREVTVSEVAELVGCSPGDVRSARSTSSGFRPTSLDAPVPMGGTEADRLADDEDAFGRLEVGIDLREAVAALGARDRAVVRLRFVEELTQSQIGTALGVSQMQVSRILARILGDLRGTLAADAA
ncbi:sigma-70 family RNA polymerase sigma factor [Phycicoccus sp. HDW14]|uniref:sigma-70 family RNA polymerase sigma factor n=1 Tax=Phycicoccus sp. HDW14 TaxID=2714941 RepID=UPI00140C8342|nr:sigma-70 family RNA polymerase sigma factor [Phycicoccus sp. HDW14]QIM21887.1 sigma-70 family RNA polymerase sigma factor [Phycicoccus sp. HDW14]